MLCGGKEVLINKTNDKKTVYGKYNKENDHIRAPIVSNRTFYSI